MSEIEMSMPSCITANVVPQHHRLAFLPRHFGPRWMMRGEAMLYDFARRLCPAYRGGLWDFIELSNGGFYLRPSDMPQPLLVSSPNGAEHQVSADAFGIVCTLFTLSHLSFEGFESDGYHELFAYACEHEQVSFIASLID